MTIREETWTTKEVIYETMPAVTERIIEISVLNINRRKKILRQKKQPNETSEDET